MIVALVGDTKPEAGVTTTRPATTPETQPRALGLPFMNHSPTPQERPAAAALALPFMNHSATAQEKPAAAAAKCVAAKAEEAIVPAFRALPALKPNQPT